MVRGVVVALTLAAVAAPCGAQVPVPDTGVVAQFMRRLGWVAVFGAWAKQRDIDPLTDSVKANLYVTIGLNPDLSGVDLRGGGFAEFGISCDDYPQRFLFVFSDSTSHFEKTHVWVRYRVDDRPASEWAQWEGQASGSLIRAMGLGAEYSRLLTAMLAGSRKLVVRVRAGRAERDHFFLLDGFASAYRDCGR